MNLVLQFESRLSNGRNSSLLFFYQNKLPKKFVKNSRVPPFLLFFFFFSELSFQRYFYFLPNTSTFNRYCNWTLIRTTLLKILKAPFLSLYSKTYKIEYTEKLRDRNSRRLIPPCQLCKNWARLKFLSHSKRAYNYAATEETGESLRTFHARE